MTRVLNETITILITKNTTILRGLRLMERKFCLAETVLIAKPIDEVNLKLTCSITIKFSFLAASFKEILNIFIYPSLPRKNLFSLLDKRLLLFFLDYLQHWTYCDRGYQKATTIRACKFSMVTLGQDKAPADILLILQWVTCHVWRPSLIEHALCVTDCDPGVR